MTAPNPTIERMREAAAAAPSKPSVAQLRTIVDGLDHVLPLETIAHTAGLPPERVYALVGEFGAWLSRSLGAPRTDIREDTESQLSLFQIPGHGDAARVIVPFGFTPTRGHGITKSLASIVAHRPDDTILTRFIDRTYGERTKVLTFSTLATVHRFAQLGRLDELGDINPSDDSFRQVLVSAYDTLDVAIDRAHAALDALVAADSADPDTVLDLCAQARWLAEGDLSRIERLAATATTRPQAQPALARELTALAARLSARPGLYRVRDIAALNDGQVLRIAAQAGIGEGVSPAEVREVREGLRALGLDSELGRLVPEGVRAAQAGILDQFWVAMGQLAAGDLTWAAQLSHAHELVNA